MTDRKVKKLVYALMKAIHHDGDMMVKHVAKHILEHEESCSRLAVHIQEFESIPADDVTRENIEHFAWGALGNLGWCGAVIRALGLMDGSKEQRTDRMLRVVSKNYPLPVVRQI